MDKAEKGEMGEMKEKEGEKDIEEKKEKEEKEREEKEKMKQEEESGKQASDIKSLFQLKTCPSVYCLYWVFVFILLYAILLLVAVTYVSPYFTMTYETAADEIACGGYCCAALLGRFQMYWNMSVAIPIAYIAAAGVLLFATIQRSLPVLKIWVWLMLCLIMMDFILRTYYYLSGCQLHLYGGALTLIAVLIAAYQVVLTMKVCCFVWRLEKPKREIDMQLFMDATQRRLDRLRHEYEPETEDAAKTEEERLSMEDDKAGDAPTPAKQAAALPRKSLPPSSSAPVIRSTPPPAPPSRQPAAPPPPPPPPPPPQPPPEPKAAAPHPPPPVPPPPPPAEPEESFHSTNSQFKAPCEISTSSSSTSTGASGSASFSSMDEWASATSVRPPPPTRKPGPRGPPAQKGPHKPWEWA